MSNGRRNNSNNFLGSDFPGNFSIFGNRTSIFEDFFGHDPFDDPFFREPFGSFFGSSQFPSMLNSSQSIFGRTNGFGAHPQLLSEMLPATNQQGNTSAPVIEEVNDDVANHRLNNEGTGQQPIVEHPDEDENPECQDQARKTPIERPEIRQKSQDNFSSSFSYHSSSVRMSGIGGKPYYSSTVDRRQGSNGMFEEHRTEEDSSGRREIQISRALGEKGRTIKKVRAPDGSDQVVDTLHNMNPEETKAFDERWQSRASQLRSHFNLNSNSPPQTGIRPRPLLLEPSSPQRKRRISIQEDKRTQH